MKCIHCGHITNILAARDIISLQQKRTRFALNYSYPYMFWSLIINQKKWSKKLVPFWCHCSFIILGKSYPLFTQKKNKDLLLQFSGGQIPKTVILYFVALYIMLNDQTSIKFLLPCVFLYRFNDYHRKQLWRLYCIGET